MLGVIAWTSQLAFALCLATDVDLGLPGGLLGIFGYGEGLPGAVPLPASRFLAVQAHEADEAKSDRRDDLRAQFEVLNTDRYDRSLMNAKRKRDLAADTLSAARRSGQHGSEPTHGEEAQAGAKEDSMLHAFNMKQAAVLEAEATKQEDEARQIKQLVEAVKLSASNSKESLVTECEILKIGPLTFVTNPDELLQNKPSNMAQITGSALTIHQNKQLKNTYFLDGVELPIKAIEDSSNCFTFPYRGTEQVFCAPSPMARDSWIDALSEAWFCRHTGLKGTLPSIQHAEKEAKLEPIPPPPPPKKPEEKPKAAVNVDFSVDDRRQFRVKVNGLEQPIGEHMVFDVEKFAKEGGQPEEQAVSQAALDISKRAEQVASKIESSAATTELPSLHKEAETEITVDSEETAPEETKAEEEENEEAEQEESDQDE